MTFEGLEEWWTLIGIKLQEAVSPRAKVRVPFHIPTLITISDDGPRPRSVVLREACLEKRLIRCHTDRRASKVADIARDPRVAWHFYDQADGIQVTVSGRAWVLVEGEIVDRAWASTRPLSRRCYMAQHGPGQPVESRSSGLPEEFEKRQPTSAESEVGRHNFAMVFTEVTALEAMLLGFNGHTKARWTWADSQWKGTWLTP